MARIEWDGVTNLMVYKEHKSSRRYRCLNCNSTNVREKVLETDIGRRNKIKCHRCKKYIIYSTSMGQSDFEDITSYEL